MWKTIPEYNNYECSDNGDIRNIESNTILHTSLNQRGYKQVCVWDKTTTKRKILFPHRIVAQLYIDNPNNKPMVNHIDGNQTNNNVNNLEWCTNSENLWHAKHVLHKNFGGLNKKAVKCLETGEIFSSCCEAAEKYNVSNVHINMLCNKKGHGKTCRGLHFIFI